MASIGPEAPEEMFENVDGQQNLYDFEQRSKNLSYNPKVLKYWDTYKH